MGDCLSKDGMDLNTDFPTNNCSCVQVVYINLRYTLRPI